MGCAVYASSPVVVVWWQRSRSSSGAIVVAPAHLIVPSVNLVVLQSVCHLTTAVNRASGVLDVSVCCSKVIARYTRHLYSYY